MGLFTRSEKRSDREVKLSQWTPQLWYGNTVTNIQVNRQSALSIPAFSNAVKIISQTVATLPTHIFKFNNDSREKAKYHYLYKLVHSQPNRYQTSFEFWEYIVTDLILEGNAYCLIERSGKYNDVVAIHPLTASMVQKEWKDGDFIYRYNNGETTTVYPAHQIWHLKNAGDGVTGTSIIDQYKETIKQALTIEAFTSLYFEQGPNSNLILETPEGTAPPDENAIKAIQLFWKKINKSKNKHVPNIIPGGLKVQELKNTNLKESQLLELKTYVVQQIARIFNLPPHILADLSKSSFNNIVEQNRNILTFAINPYLHRIEKSVNAFLLHDWEKERFYCEFTRDALVEANPVEKSEQIKNLITAGVYSINQGKAMYNLPAVKGGNESLVLTQMTTLENLKEVNNDQ